MLDKPYITQKIREYLQAYHQAIGRKLVADDVLNQLASIYKHLEQDPNKPLKSITFEQFQMVANTQYIKTVFGV